ncbi:hypothetical protein WN51_03266 [Melipona quadrifasciata]|uniref:Uncharacterized protein n=1 Tax=Melipona quadrifasciata TaxID=166423 RepID=A0A0N0BER3_9HYME|nr:hypothetical protein WN51_03266 [Melipona quadrifasciata]
MFEEMKVQSKDQRFMRHYSDRSEESERHSTALLDIKCDIYDEISARGIDGEEKLNFLGEMKEVAKKRLWSRTGNVTGNVMLRTIRKEDFYATEEISSEYIYVLIVRRNAVKMQCHQKENCHRHGESFEYSTGSVLYHLSSTCNESALNVKTLIIFQATRYHFFHPRSGLFYRFDEI